MGPSGFGDGTGYSIGIDLGTARICTAVFRNDRAEIVPHEGQSFMPCYVAFTKTGRLIGAAAKNQASANPTNTLFGALRFIGRKYDDPETQQMIKGFPFRVARDASGSPTFVVQHRGGVLTMTAMEVLSILLSRVRRDAQRYLGNYPMSAVITVPASFSSIQRHAVSNAAMIADIKPLRLLGSAVGACLDYMIKQQPVDKTNILIADFGAGSMDVAIATLEHGVVEIQAIAGANDVGGDDIDTCLVRYAANVFKRETSSDLTRDSRALRRLRTACEKAKQELSSQTQTTVYIDQLCDGHDFVWTLTRQSLEECFSDPLRACLVPIKQALKDAGIEKSRIHVAIVIGGSSRTPQLQHRVSELLNFMDIAKCLNPDETAARGVAFEAAILSGDLSSRSTAETLLVDVVPFTIGIGTREGIISPLLQRNTSIPTKKADTFTLTEDDKNNKSFFVSVFEGESAHTMYNMCLGKSVVPLSHLWDNVPQMVVTVDCDQDNEFEIHVLDKATGVRIQVPCLDTDRLSMEDLVLLKAKAAGFNIADETEERRIEAKNAAEGYVFALLDRLGSQPQTDIICRKVHLANRLLVWLDENNDAAFSEYTAKLHQLQEFAEITVDSGTEQRPVVAEQKETEEVFDHLVNMAEKPKKTGADDVRSQTESETEVNDEERSNARSPSMIPSSTDLSTPPATEARSDKKLDVRSSLGSSPVGITVDLEPLVGNEELAVDTAVEKMQDIAQPSLDNDHIFSQPCSPPARVPSVSNVSNKSSTLRSETPQSTARGMSELFSKPKVESIVYTDADFVCMSTYLANVGRLSWSMVPRLYTVLRLIDKLDMLDFFIDQGITDIWFPFTQMSLPSAMSPTAKAHFLEHQHAVLSKSLLFEIDSNRTHTHFGQGEPLPFQVVAKLGAGAHGQVDKVMSTVSCREYARKLFRRRRGVSQDAIKSFLVELRVLKRVQHRHCIELVQSYTDPKYFALIMVPVGQCDLYEYYKLARDSPDKLSLLRSFFGCLSNALEYIHSIKIRHRDIKPQNILVKGDKVFLTDFGIALDWEHLSRSTTTADSGKTLIYAAPEVMRYQRRNSSADVWSLGCVFFEMVTVLKGETVDAMREFFTERSGSRHFHANGSNLGKWASTLRGKGSAKDDAVFKWVRAMLDEEAEDRPTAATLYADITATCVSQHALFCGSCCLEAVDSSDVEDDDDDELWGQAAELTLGHEPT